MVDLIFPWEEVNAGSSYAGILWKLSLILIFLFKNPLVKLQPITQKSFIIITIIATIIAIVVLTIKDVLARNYYLLFTKNG